MENTTPDLDEKFTGWVILELMGHRRLTGYLSEQEIAGRAFLRIDIPTEPPATQFYGAEAVYCITPTTEEMAREASRLNHVTPISRWELPPARPVTETGAWQDEHGTEFAADGQAADGSHPF